MTDNDRQQNYVAVLADIEQRIVELQRTAASIRELMGMASTERGTITAQGQDFLGQTLVPGRQPSKEDPLALVKVGDFYGKSYAEAAKEFLKRTNEAQTTQTILNALRKAHFELKAKNPASILYTSLSRHKGFELVSRNTWGLTEWYPDATRKKKLEVKATKKTKRNPKKEKGEAKIPMTEGTEIKE